MSGVEHAKLNVISSMYDHNRIYILDEFQRCKPTGLSGRVLGGIQGKTIRVFLRRNLGKMGLANGRTISVDRTMHLHNALALLVHEGRRHFELIEGTIPPRRRATYGDRLFAEARALGAEMKFVATNNLVHSQAYRFRGVATNVVYPEYSGPRFLDHPASYT